VLLGEPERTRADLNFSLGPIPVRIHPFFWLIGLLFGLQLAEGPNALRLMLVWLIAFFVSILFHELGHALVMLLYGFRPWITLYGLGGLTSRGDLGVYSSRRLSAGAEVLISAAGPAAGFLLAGVIAGMVGLAGYNLNFELSGGLPRVEWDGVVGSVYLNLFLLLVVTVNIYWGLLNLMPVYPLDGGQITREILVATSPREGIRQSLLVSVAAAVVLALLGLVQWRSFFLALLFGYLAWVNYTTLQRYGGRGGSW
jgi:stage IV sporulation protein FB